MTGTLRALLVAVPPWLVILLWFAVFSAVAFIARWLVMRIGDEKRREELAQHSHKLAGALGATFAFLVGFAITITWSSVGEGQQIVEEQAAHAQQLAWSVNGMREVSVADPLLTSLKAYLEAVAYRDGDVLARGAGDTLPSSEPLAVLADQVHAVAFAPDTSMTESAMLTSNLQGLAMGQASIVALSQRQLPILLALLLVTSGVAMAAVAGIGAATVARPYLLLVWCFVSALAISVAFILDHPFGGALAVDFRPVIVVADSLPGP